MVRGLCLGEDMEGCKSEGRREEEGQWLRQGVAGNLICALTLRRVRARARSRSIRGPRDDDYRSHAQTLSRGADLRWTCEEAAAGITGSSE